MHPSVPVVMRLIGAGKITIKEGSEILNCSPKTVHNYMKEFGVEVINLGTTQSRKQKSEDNAARNNLLETLAKQVKFEGKDLHALCAEHHIPSRTLYRWVAKV